MAAPTGSLLDQHSDRIQEFISKTIGTLQSEIDPFWRGMINTTQGVTSASEFGRDYKMLKIYMGSFAGVIEQGGPRDDFGLYGDNAGTNIGTRQHTLGLSNTWPSALNGSNPLPIRLGIPMRSMNSNLLLTMGMANADLMDASIGSLLSNTFVGFGRNWATQICNYWYLSQNQHYRLGYIDGSSGTGWDKTQDTNTRLMVDMKYSSYTEHRFHTGMRVSFYDSTGATIRSTASGCNTFFVDAVDHLTGKVYFRATDGAALNGAAFADDDIIVFAGSKGTATTPYAASPYFTGIAGINSWQKFGGGGNDNYLLGAERDTSNTIDVTNHPEFKSMLYSMGNAPLTEHKLGLILQRFHAAKDVWGQSIDTLVSTPGVWAGWRAQLIGRETIERYGRTASLMNQGFSNEKLGGADASITIDGRSYTCYTTHYEEAGTLRGLKRGGNNFKRYVPPKTPNSKSSSDVPAGVPFEFVAPHFTGTDSIRMPIMVSDSDNLSQLSEGIQLPGMLRMQIVPEQAAGLKVTNISEERLYADS